MLLQTTPNKWSCLPTSFAMVTNTPLEEIIKELGHDGSEILWPNLEEPFCYRSFHIQELISILFYSGILVVEFQVWPVSAPQFPNITNNIIHFPEGNEQRIYDIMHQGKGVVKGEFRNKPHAAAWDGNQIFDPGGFTYNLDQFNIMSYYHIE